MGSGNPRRERGDQAPASGDDTPDAAELLWFALCMAPEEGTGIGELMRITGMSRPTLYRYLAQHAQAGRAGTTEEPHGE